MSVASTDKRVAASSLKVLTPVSGGISSRYAAVPGVKAAMPSKQNLSLACKSVHGDGRTPAQVSTFVPELSLALKNAGSTPSVVECGNGVQDSISPGA